MYIIHNLQRKLCLEDGEGNVLNLRALAFMVGLTGTQHWSKDELCGRISDVLSLGKKFSEEEDQRKALRERTQAAKNFLKRLAQQAARELAIEDPGGISDVDILKELMRRANTEW